jgi:hypothetical protein
LAKRDSFDGQDACPSTFAELSSACQVQACLEARRQKEKFPNKPILKIRKPLSINNKRQKMKFDIAKNKPGAA